MDITCIKLVRLKFSIIFLLLLFCSNMLSEPKHSLIIGFGSCVWQKVEQPIWGIIGKHNPDLFILMGDNTYIDSSDPAVIEAAYMELSSDPHFARFRESTPLIATWDDHDYGIKDSGKFFAGKQATKDAFIQFFDYPELRQTEKTEGGIQHSRWLDFHGKKIQIILLDTRWYRDFLVKSYLTKKQQKLLNLGDLQPTLDETTTLLGQAQWIWLEEELKKPADLKILVSSIQVLAEFTGWETWANFPHERKKLLELIVNYTDHNLLILSGDAHKGEISKIIVKGKDILEITSSPLAAITYANSNNENNRHKQGESLVAHNYGILKIQVGDSLQINASVYDVTGVEKLSVQFSSGHGE